MLARTKTVAFQGIETLPIDVQVQISSGLPRFNIVGLADKAVGESRERIRGALQSVGLALPLTHISVNLSPADVQKEGSHYDLPIILGLLGAMDILPVDTLERYIAMGEIALDGSLSPVQGILVAAMTAMGQDMGIICPAVSGSEAAWAGRLEILAPKDIVALINHFKGHQLLTAPKPLVQPPLDNHLDLADVKGQSLAKRALEITAAGGHNMLMNGPPGSGKSMLAQRLVSILPPLTPKQALEVTMIHSVAGVLGEGHLITQRPFRDPHHSASLPALVGGGTKAKPGEITLAHNGVLFLDELPEFARPTLEALRQPLESGQVSIARVNAHITYPARFQLIAAMNPCRCGNLGSSLPQCAQAPRCGEFYQQKLSGPLLDRFDIHVDVPQQDIFHLRRHGAKVEESSSTVAERVVAAHRFQLKRVKTLGLESFTKKGLYANAHISTKDLEKSVVLDDECHRLLEKAHQRFVVSGRAYHRILRVARSIADLEASDAVTAAHLTEALMFRPAAHALPPRQDHQFSRAV